MKPSKFIITGFPRMRSAWFAAYLTQGDVLCYHEASFNNDDMNAPGYAHVGNSDSGYLFTNEDIGEHKIVVIERDMDEVAKSLEGIGQGGGEWLLHAMKPQLDALEGLHIGFHEVDKRMEEIHDYLGIGGYSEERHALFANLNIQSQDWR